MAVVSQLGTDFLLAALPHLIQQALAVEQRLLQQRGCRAKACRNPPGRRMLSSFGEHAIKTMVAESMKEAMRLENAMRHAGSERTLVVLHYASVEDTIAGEPLEIFPFLGSSSLAETIHRFKVSAVVHGH